jgi:hypothetical protein
MSSVLLSDECVGKVLIFRPVGFMFKGLGVMKKFTAESHRHLLIVLFFLFETLFLASVVTPFYVDSRQHFLIRDAGGITFLFSFVGLLIVCFLLRRITRPFAVAGWFTLSGCILIITLWRLKNVLNAY